MAREEDPDSADLARERELEWQQIIENFGDRAVLESDDIASVEVTPAGAPDDRETEDLSDPTEVRDQIHQDEEFVPPTPPPVPRPPMDRLLAWSGVFGVPVLVLICIVTKVSVPSWFGLLLAAAFIGGFGYLVVRMSDEPRDPWDDGAVL